MSLKEQDQFTYYDIKPKNYKAKQELVTDLEEISKTLENITNDWKERETSLNKISSICLGNQGKSDLFLKYFNSKLLTSDCLNERKFQENINKLKKETEKKKWYACKIIK